MASSNESEGPPAERELGESEEEEVEARGEILPLLGWRLELAEETNWFTAEPKSKPAIPLFMVESPQYELFKKELKESSVPLVFPLLLLLVVVEVVVLLPLPDEEDEEEAEVR